MRREKKEREQEHKIQVGKLRQDMRKERQKACSQVVRGQEEQVAGCQKEVQEARKELEVARQGSKWVSDLVPSRQGARDWRSFTKAWT